MRNPRARLTNVRAYEKFALACKKCANAHEKFAHAYEKLRVRAYEVSGITVTEGESWFAGGGMYFVYLLGLAAIAAIVVAEVNKAIK